MKITNWKVDHHATSEQEFVEKAWRNQDTLDKVVVEEYRDDKGFVVNLYDSNGNTKDLLFEHDNKTNCLNYARCWMKRHPTTDIPDDWKAKNKIILSTEGFKLLDEQGYYEDHIPIFYEEEGEYHHLTVDYVSDEAPEVDMDAGDEEFRKQQRHRQRYLARNLYNLIEEGKVETAYDDHKIANVCDLVGLKNEISISERDV